jgi:hypothetical protein
MNNGSSEGFNLDIDSEINTLILNTVNYGTNGITIKTNYNKFISNSFSFNSGVGIQIVGGDYNNYTSNIINNNLNIGIYLNQVNHSIFISNTINNNFGNGLELTSNLDIYNNFTSNIIKNNSNYGIFFSHGNDNIFNLNTITNNNVSNIHFFATGVPISNLFYNNNLGNISKISANDWTDWNNNFNSSSVGNTYYNDSSYSGSYCFAVNNCDNFADIQTFPVAPSPSISSVSVNSLPSFGVGSALVVLAVLVGFLLF